MSYSSTPTSLPCSVDREGRNIVANRLRQFLDCRLTDVQFEQSLRDYFHARGVVSSPVVHREKGDWGVFPLYTPDRGIDAILWHVHISLCLNITPVYLKDCYAPSREVRNAIERDLLFLEGELHYEWIETNWLRRARLWRQMAWVVLNVLTGFYAGRREWRAYEKQGCYEVWPFFRREDYSRALDQALTPGRATAACPPHEETE